MRVAICFAQFGPYHHARILNFQEVADFPVVPLQLAAATSTYAWDSGTRACTGLQTLCPGNYETLKPLKVFARAWRFFRKEKISCALLPSYAPAAETALFLAAKLAGVRCIMMNESHAGTERATGWKKQIKRCLVARFDAALVGGQPQKRHFTQLGMPQERIFTGYDAIDNAYFESASQGVRADALNHRKALGLPDKYFLSLGRMVEKKNLSCLIEAYAQFAAQSEARKKSIPLPALVFVGNGPQEASLKALCQALKLPTIDHPTDLGLHAITPAQAPSNSLTDTPTHRPDLSSVEGPAVHFYGFRQIDENPTFYALADAFILPSLWEEWGLVVNEAMACSLPVVVSQTVGSAEDLVKNGENGYIFDPKSAEQLAGHLEALHTHPELRNQMSQRSKAIIANWGCDNFARNAIAAVECAVED
jgi:glycosyltransferase involved in cell wall biosynthesis